MHSYITIEVQISYHNYILIHLCGRMQSSVTDANYCLHAIKIYKYTYCQVPVSNNVYIKKQL